MRLNLRHRIFAACFGIGAGIGVLFGGLSLTLLEITEFEQVDLVLADEIKRFAEAHAKDPELLPPRTSFLEVWVAPSGDVGSLPEDLRDLAPGARELDDGGRERRVVVADLSGWRYAATMDLTLMEPWENRITGVVVGLVTLCALAAALLGRWLSNRVIAPLSQLAARVSEAGDDGGVVSRGAFSLHFADDEVGQLARALDGYDTRLRAFAAREREFSAHASHELRTPLAIASGALELVLDAGGLTPKSAVQLRRAGAALEWMTETIESLMFLARMPIGTAPDVQQDPAPILREVVAGSEDLARDHGVRVECRVEPCERVAALPGAVRAVMRNLVANACAHAQGGNVTVVLAGDTLTVRNSGRGIGEGDQKRVFEPFFRGEQARGVGEGLGLAIVKRICEHYGWQVVVRGASGEGVIATVKFASPPATPA